MNEKTRIRTLVIWGFAMTLIWVMSPSRSQAEKWSKSGGLLSGGSGRGGNPNLPVNEKLFHEATHKNLLTERQDVCEEIMENLLYEQEDQEKALVMIRKTPSNTRKDNVLRILMALAQVDPSFKQAWLHYQAGEFGAANKVIKKILNPEDASYHSAASYYLYALLLEKDAVVSWKKNEGKLTAAVTLKYWKAVNAYSDVLLYVGLKRSFSAESALRAAAIYDRLNRFQYARDMNKYALDMYNLDLSPEERKTVLERWSQLDKLCADPMKSVIGKMGEVKKRLAASDSGDVTLENQEMVVLVLEDIIKTAEDARKSQPPSESRQR